MLLTNNVLQEQISRAAMPKPTNANKAFKAEWEVVGLMGH
jgi:hypothetical protein